MNDSINIQKRNPLWFAFILSGAAGLIYEILWMRLLTVAFGNTVVATTIVLSAFMAGLALGGFLLGRMVDRVGKPLLAYGLMEFGIAISAFPLYFLLKNLPTFCAIVYQKIKFSEIFLNITWFSFSFLLLVLPTTLMGGTWPALSKFLTRERKSLGVSTGSLYSLNTLGAVAGCLVTGFWLLGNVGLKNTAYIAVALNLFSACVAILINFAAKEKEHGLSFETEVIEEEAFPENLRRLALITIFISGLCALAYELLWTHTLIFFLDNSTWAFTTMLATFLSGITVGSWAVRRFADRKENLLELLGLAELAIGLLAFLSLIWLWQVFPISHLWAIFKNHNIFWFLRILLILGSSFLVMFPATLFMGAAFVFASKLNSKKLNILGKNLGDVYGFNTLGAIVGPILAGFVLLPILGLKKSIFAFVILNIFTGIAVLFFAQNYTKRASLKVSENFTKRATLEVCTFIAVFLVIATYVTLLPIKPFLADNESAGDETIFYKEGLAGAVKVWRRGNTKAMAVNGHEIAATQATLDEKQKLLVHLPMSISPLSHPRKALTIGFGSGITAGSMSLWEDFEKIDAVEIVPAVVEAARLFQEENKNILNNPKVNISVCDGVNYLLTTDESYDLIVSDGKMNPTYVGNGVLYSQDYYKLCFDRLSEDGVFSQWIPLYIPPSIYRMILASFSSVFPHFTIWNFESGNTIYIGSKKPQEIDFAIFKDKLENTTIKNELAKFELDNTATLLSAYVGDENDIKPKIRDAALNTLEHPYIEFNAPFEFMRTFTNQNENQNLSFLLGLNGDVLAHFKSIDEDSKDLNKFIQAKRLTKFGIALVRRGNLIARGKSYFEEALKINPEDKVAQQYLEKAKVEKEDAIKRAEENPIDTEALFTLGAIYFFEGETEQAIEKLQKAKQQAKQLNPEHPQVDNYLGNCYFMRGEFEKAIKAYEDVLKIKKEAGIYYNLGMAYENLGQLSDAKEFYLKAVHLDPNFLPAQEKLK